MSTEAPKIITIDNEQYRLIEIWVDYLWDDMLGKIKVYALEPIEQPRKES